MRGIRGLVRRDVRALRSSAIALVVAVGMVAVMAGLVSVLTSLGGLPEVQP